jgi:hypothetical protein
VPRINSQTLLFRQRPCVVQCKEVADTRRFEVLCPACRSAEAELHYEGGRSVKQNLQSIRKRKKKLGRGLKGLYTRGGCPEFSSSRDGRQHWRRTGRISALPRLPAPQKFVDSVLRTESIRRSSTDVGGVAEQCLADVPTSFTAACEHTDV